MTVILNLIFRRVGDKNFKFCLENQGGGSEGGTCYVLRPCHPPKKKIWNVHLCIKFQCLSMNVYICISIS